MSFDTKNGTIYEPKNAMLWSFYEMLKQHAPSLAGSQAYEDFKEVYETLDYDITEENK